MASKLFPFFSSQASQTLTLEIDAAETAKTVDFVVDARTVNINAQGADAAPTYTVNLRGGQVGMVFVIDVTSLDARAGGDTADAKVKFVKGDNSVLIDASGEDATVMITESGLIDASNFLGSHFGSTTDATFA